MIFHYSRSILQALAAAAPVERVSTDLWIGNGNPPKFLLKLINLSDYSTPPPRTLNPDATGDIDYATTASILADFYILDDLRVDIIFGEDLLATIDAFVRLS